MAENSWEEQERLDRERGVMIEEAEEQLTYMTEIFMVLAKHDERELADWVDKERDKIKDKLQRWR